MTSQQRVGRGRLTADWLTCRSGGGGLILSLSVRASARRSGERTRCLSHARPRLVLVRVHQISLQRWRTNGGRTQDNSSSRTMRKVRQKRLRGRGSTEHRVKTLCSTRTRRTLCKIRAVSKVHSTVIHAHWGHQPIQPAFVVLLALIRKLSYKSCL